MPINVSALKAVKRLEQNHETTNRSEEHPQTHGRIIHTVDITLNLILLISLIGLMELHNVTFSNPINYNLVNAVSQLTYQIHSYLNFTRVTS